MRLLHRKTYQIAIASAKGLRSQMNRDQTTAAAGVESHARALEIIGVRDTVGHDGISGASRGILGLPVHVTQTDLLVV